MKTISVRVKKGTRRRPKVCPTCGGEWPARRQVLPEDLTDRQKAILKLVAQGMTAKQMGQELRISSRTAEFHRMMLMQRLNLHTIAELTLYAAVNGLLDK